MADKLSGPSRKRHFRYWLDRLVYGFFRFLIYGMVGVVAEVSNYSLVKIGRKFDATRWIFQADWHVDNSLGLDAIWSQDCRWTALFGQCSLWMFPVYGLCALFIIERIYRQCRKWGLNMLVRGSLYSLAIMAFEFFSGFILHWITTYDIWIYRDRFNLLGMTTLYLFPLWFITGLFVELICRELKNSGLRGKADEVVENILS